MDMVIGIKNVYEIERVISTRDLCFHFSNKSNPFSPKTEILHKPRKQMLIKNDVPLLDEISGLVMTKILDLKTGCTNMLKVKFIRNTGFLDVTNNLSEPLSKDVALCIVDLRSTGHYKVK